MTNNVNYKQKKAIRLLLTGTSKSDVAISCGVQRETLSRWFNDPGFRSELANAQRGLLLETITRLVSGNDDAITVISEIVNDDKKSPSVRLRAAIAWLEQQRKSLETMENQEIVERLERLEDENAKIE